MRVDERISAAALPLMYRFMGRPYPQMLRVLRRTERLPEAELAALQLDRIKALVAHCHAHVPYYRRVFAEMSITPADIRTLDDFASLAAMDKTTLRENATELVADTHPISAMQEVWTSGSTATPVMVRYDRDYFDWGWATLLRNLEWTGFKQGERQLWLTREDTGGIKRIARLALERKWIAGVVVQSPETIAKWAEDLKRIRPRLVYSTPSSRLSELAAYLLENDIRVEGVRAVMTTSETLLDSTRDLIERGLRARVFDQYGSTECLSIASECADGSMHVNAETNLVEYTPLEAAPGSFEMIVTPLMNYGMPLLRYRLGDMGAPVDGPCACGRTLPRMRMHAGRTAASVRLSDGSVLTPFSLEELIHHVPGVVRFQFRQVEPDVFDLLVVKASPEDTSVDEALRAIDEEFERNNGIRLTFRVSYVDDIPLTSSGKHLYVIPLKR